MCGWTILRLLKILLLQLRGIYFILKGFCSILRLLIVSRGSSRLQVWLPGRKSIYIEEACLVTLSLCVCCLPCASKKPSNLFSGVLRPLWFFWSHSVILATRIIWMRVFVFLPCSLATVGNTGCLIAWLDDWIPGGQKAWWKGRRGEMATIGSLPPFDAKVQAWEEYVK